jgi:hypothetical protein
MKKNEYIQMLITDNQTTCDKQKLYFDVIDCTEIGLSQVSSDFEVDRSIGLEDLFKIIEDAGRKNKNNCVGPFEAAELIAEKLGTKYVRTSKRNAGIVNLEEFL